MRSLTNVLRDKMDSRGFIWVEKLGSLAIPIQTVEQLLTSDSFKLAEELTLYINEIEALKKSVSGSMIFDKATETNESVKDTYSWKQLHSLLDITGAGETTGLGNYSTAYDDINDSIQTGFPDLDGLFKGGLQKNGVISILGDSGSGKTHLAICIAVTNAVKGLRVLLIDTCNGVNVKRIRNMAQCELTRRFTKMDERNNDNMMISANSNTTAEKDRQRQRLSRAQMATLDRIHLQQVFNLWDAFSVLCRTKEASPAYDLVIVDCFHQLISPYLADIKGDRSQSVTGGSGAGSSTGGSSSGSSSSSSSGRSVTIGQGTATAVVSGTGTGTGTGIALPFGTKSTSTSTVTITSNPLVLHFNLLLKSLCGNGCTTVVVTNVLEKPGKQTKSSFQGRPSSHGGNTREVCRNSASPLYPSGTGAIGNHVDTFDAAILLTRGGNREATEARDDDAPLEPVIHADVVLRPPYHNHLPTRCQLRI